MLGEGSRFAVYTGRIGFGQSGARPVPNPSPWPTRGMPGQGSCGHRRETFHAAAARTSIASSGTTPRRQRRALLVDTEHRTRWGDQVIVGQQPKPA